MRALFIGNGINRLGPQEDDKSWEGVLRILAAYADMTKAETERLKGKPFPLAFEAIYNHKLSKCPSCKETELRQRVAQLVEGFPINEYHRKIVALPVPHILTTNYDYCLERAIKSETPRGTGSPPKTNFCLNLRHQFSDRSVWHIHGEQNYAKTIMLGHDHYCGYLAPIRRALIVPTVRKKSAEIESRRIKRKKAVERCERWIDVFLSADVDIIGFEFDFTETVLWWLLQFRAKCIQRRAWPNALPIGSVRFHDIHGPKEATPIQLTRNELLRLFDVEVVSYPQQDWSSSYNAFIEKFTTNAQSISGPAWSKANF